MRKTLSTFCLIALAALAAGCSRQNEPAASQKAPESQPPVAATPAPDENASLPRIVSAAPAATLQLVEMGAVDRLVGVSSYDKVHLPEDKQNLPVVGDYLNFDYEKLLLLKPTHVIIQMADNRLAPRLKEIAEKNHIELINVKLSTLDDLFATAEKLGQAAGVQDRAQLMISMARGQLAAIEQKTSSLPKPKTIYIMGKNPIFVVGKDGLWDQMLAVAGASNAGAQVKGDYFPQISTETLISMAPEVLLISAPGEPNSLGASDPRLKQWYAMPIPAARANRIHLITAGGMQMGSLAIGDNVLTLAHIIHPELKDWSPEEETDAPAPKAQENGK